MRRAGRLVVGVSWVLALSGGVACAEQGTVAQPAMDSAKQKAMEAMQRLGSPSEGHTALEPLAGSWSYTAQWWMSPEAPPESMTGTALNSLIFGGRFLKQDIRGAAEGQPSFEASASPATTTSATSIKRSGSTTWPPA